MDFISTLNWNEAYLVPCIVAVFFFVNAIAFILHFLYKSLSDSALREAIRCIICTLDEFADDMENSQKRAAAIKGVNETLGWKKIVIPNVVIGCIIDLQVKLIRKMEKANNTPDLHQKEEEEI